MFQMECIIGKLQCRSVQATHAISGNRHGNPLILLNSVLGVRSMLKTDINSEALFVEILYGKTDHPFIRMFYKQVLQHVACLWGDDEHRY